MGSSGCGSGWADCSRHAQSSETPWIYKAQFPSRGKLQDRVGVLGDFRLRFTNLQAAGHAQMDDPLGFRVSFGFSAVRRWEGCRAIEIEDDMLPHAADFCDAGLFEDRSDFCGWRFQWLLLAADPDRFDHVTADTLGQTAGYRFYFREFGHGFNRIITTQDAKLPKENLMYKSPVSLGVLGGESFYFFRKFP